MGLNYNSFGEFFILGLVATGLYLWRRHELRKPFYRSYTKLVFDYNKINKK